MVAFAYREILVGEIEVEVAVFRSFKFQTPSSVFLVVDGGYIETPAAAHAVFHVDLEIALGKELQIEIYL